MDKPFNNTPKYPHIYNNKSKEDLQYCKNVNENNQASCYDIKIASPCVRIGQCLEADNPSGRKDLLIPMGGMGLSYTPNPLKRASGKEAKALKPQRADFACLKQEGEPGLSLNFNNKIYNTFGLELQRVGKQYRAEKNCGKWYREGVCKSGHSIYRVIACMKEWCPSCGKKGSVLHKQRVWRWIGKAVYMHREAKEQGSYVGYLVFTLPMELRDWLLQDAKECNKFLRAFQNYIKRKLQRLGVKRGLMRWHWMSERNDKRYHPHLNVLYVGHYYWQKDELEAWRSEIEAWIRRHTGIDCNMNFHNSYVKDEARVWHKVKYISRPTLKRADLADYCKARAVIFGFATWDKDEMRRIKQEIDIIEAGIKEVWVHKHFEKNICPMCGEKIIWGRPEPIDNMPSDVYELSEGLYGLRTDGWEQLYLFRGG